MRKAGILVAAGIITLFFAACGGGGGGAVSTPVPTPTAAETEGELIRVTGTANYKIEPNIIELKVGQAYKIQFLNKGESAYRFRIPRWNIALPAPAGQESEISQAFTPDAPGDYDCFEQLNAVRYEMRCVVRVSP